MSTQSTDSKASISKKRDCHSYDDRRILALEAVASLGRQFSNKPESQQLAHSLLLTLTGQFSTPSTFAVLRKPDRSAAEPIFLATGEFANNKLLETLILTPDIEQYFAKNNYPQLPAEFNSNDSCARHFRILRDSDVKIVCPIMQNDGLIGLIGLGQAEDGQPFDDEDLELLDILVSPVAPLIASSYQFWEMASLSNWYHELIDSVVQGVFVFSFDSKLKKINAAGLGILGKHLGKTPSQESLQGAPIDVVFPQDALTDWSRRFVKAVTEHSWQSIEGLTVKSHADESIYDAYVCKMIGNSKFQADFIVTLDDVTERRQARKRIQESQELLRATIESTADGILVVGGDGRVTHFNNRFTDLWNIPTELAETRDDDKLLAYVMEQLVDPDAFIAKVQELYSTTKRSFDSIRFKDGRIFERFSCPLIQDGSINGRVWSFRDVTKRRQVEDALRESEERFRTLANSLPEIVFEIDLEGRLTYVNENAYAKLGYSPEEIAKGFNALDLAAPDDKARAVENFHRTVSGEEFGRSEYSVIRKDGSTFPVAIHSKLVRRDGQPIAVRGIIVDLTERNQADEQRRKLQAKLEKAERMESIGILAGGVAHDLNNMLGPMVGYPEVILKRLPDDHPARKHVIRIGKSAQKAADVIQDLLTLARRGRYDMQPLSLNDVVNEYCESQGYLQRRIDNPDVNTACKLDETIGFIIGSASHLTKVLMNLVVNAFDAMSDGGKLTIETSQEYLTSLCSGYGKIEPNEYVILRVRDTGVGIDPEDMSRIFEPYYSNKKMGASGSGLGLAIVYGIVKDHRGYYDIVSEKGKGTEFTLYFPMTTEKPQSVKDSGHEFRGNEKVLVVDDSEDQREIAAVLLSGLGYEVETVDHGKEAVEYLTENEVDIVVLDMIMEKDFDGLDTFREITRIRPGQKTIIASGFSATDRVREMQKLGAGTYVRKPYTLQTIGRAVREELDKSPD